MVGYAGIFRYGVAAARPQMPVQWRGYTHLRCGHRDPVPGSGAPPAKPWMRDPERR